MTGPVVMDARRRPGSPATPQPLSLAAVQDRFQAAVMAGDDALLALIPGNSHTTRDVLLGVYRHAYAARLVELVADDHPQLASLMGEADFDAMARAYIRAHPSRHPNARWVSQHLPEFLATVADHAHRPELAEIAGLERALADAFDAADAPILGMDELSRISPHRWGDLSFTPHPSCTMLAHATNAFSIWLALKNGDTPPRAAMAREPERLLAWRRNAMSTVRVLAPEEAMLWREAAGGVRFSVLCELAAYADPGGAALRVAQVLQSWIAAGMLSTATLVTARKSAL